MYALFKRALLGIRVGAIPLTTSKESEKKINLIQGYGGSTKSQFSENDEEYITCCTPEYVKT